jgi:hypothetical protein
MRRTAAVLVVLLALLVVAATTVSAAPKKAPWMGNWEAIDVDADGDGKPDINFDTDGDGEDEYADGSYVTLVISGGPKGTYGFHYTDYGATCCGTTEDEVPLFVGKTSGALSLTAEWVLEGDTSIECLAGPKYDADLEIHWRFEYDPETDTLFDGLTLFQRRGTLIIGE